MAEVDREEYEKLKQEFNKPKFKARLRAELGTKCRFCGAEGVDYHHIMPLSLGGTNDLNNLIPVCPTHHKMAHGATHIHENVKSGGRPSVLTPENAKAYEMYINGEIGNRKLRELVAPKSNPSGNYVPTNRKDFKRWMKSKGITKVRNTLDIAMVNAYCIVEGCQVGEVTYEDGRIEPITFHDTGANDIEYAKRSYGKKRTYSSELRAERAAWWNEYRRTHFTPPTGE